MTEKSCDLWLEHADLRCVLTSGALASDGSAVMDSRSAAEAARRYGGIEQELGRMIAATGNHVRLIRPGLVAFPIKEFQWSTPRLAIIERSARELAALVGAQKTILPNPCDGQPTLKWEDVAKCLASLPDNVVVIR